jgi:hypothetical protein
VRLVRSNGRTLLADLHGSQDKGARLRKLGN